MNTDLAMNTGAAQAKKHTQISGGPSGLPGIALKKEESVRT
jgi:hypothetical protein